ncbi:MAG: GAF domain-containing protein [Anaerolineales bacterium]
MSEKLERKKPADAVTELRLLYETAQSLIRLEDLTTTLQAAVDSMAEALAADRVVLYVVDTEREIVTHAVKGGPEPTPLAPIDFDELKAGLSGWTLKHKKTAYSPQSMMPDPRETPEVQKKRVEFGAGSIIITPLIYEGDCYGFLTIINHLDQRDFTEADVALAEKMSAQTAVAVYNARLLEQLRHRASSLETVAAVSRAASSILSIDELLPRIVTLIQERFDLYYAGIFLVDEKRQWARLRAGTGEAGEVMLAQGHKLEIGGESMIGSCVAEATPRIALDVGREAQRFENPVLPKTRSEMALPLVSREEVIGAMTIQSTQVNAFSDQDIEILQTLADQIATAIQNAELFDQSQMALSETETLYLTSRAVGEAQTIEDILKGILFTVEFVELSSASIRLISQWEDQRPVKMDVHSVAFGLDGDVTYVVHRDIPPRGIDPLLEDPEGVIIFSDIQDDEADIPERVRESMRQRGYRGALTTGLLARGRLIGFFTFSSARPLTDVSERSVRLLSRALADQVAVSMENILLVEESRQRAEQLEELSAVEAALSEANTEEEILSAVVNAIDAGPDVQARLSYLDEDPQEGVVGEAVAIWENGAIRPKDPTLDHPVRRESLPLFDLWKESKVQVQFVPDVNKLEIEEEALKTLKERYHIQALVSILLRSAGQLIGVVSLAWPEPRGFDEHEEFILRRLVRPTAALVARRRAYLAAERARFENERRATQLATVAEVSQAVSSLLDLDELLSQTVDLIKNRFDLYYTGVFLVDESERWVVLRAGTGNAGRKMLEQGHKFEVGGESMIGQCVAQGQPQIPEAVEEAVRFVNPLLPETRAEIALPLKSRGEVLGAMTIQSSTVDHFSEVDLTILETMADQLATAIINARLFAASQARLEELQRIQQRQAVESWMDYAEHEQALGFRYDLNQVTPLAPAEAASFSAPPEVWNGQLVARDNQEGGDGAALLTPIDMRGETVGVLSFEDPTARSWSDDDVAILEAVREQISLALENRVLYDQSQRALTETQRRAEEMQFLQEVAAFLNSVDDVVASQDELREQLSAFLPVAALQLIGYNARERSVSVVGEPSGFHAASLKADGAAGALWVAEEGQPWIADDLRREQRFSEDERLVAEGFQSRAILPLKLGYRTLGTLNLYSEESGAFSAEGMMTILRQTSAQIASAIERSNLLRQTRSALSEAEVLSQASSALSKATSYEAVLSAILEHTILQESVRAEIGLFVQDPATGAAHDWIEVVAARSNHPALSAWEIGRRLPVEEAPGLRLAGSEAVYVCPDIETATDLPAEVRDYYREQGIRAIVVTPLLVSGERLGLFRMGFLEPYDPSEQELRIYRTIAGQAAVVLSNRQLLQVSQDRAERLESAVEMASLTTGIMEREDLLMNAVDFFKERFDLYYAGIFLLDDEGQWAVLEAGTGEAGKKLQQMGFRLLVDGDSPVGRCVRTTENQITLDVSAEEEDRFDNPLLPDTQSEVALPLISRGQVIGAMSIQSDQRFAFTEDDVATLQLMVNQLANVIESTNLYERSQNSLEETSTLYHIAQRVADARTVEDVLQAAVDGISQREEPDVVAAALLLPADHPTELRTEVAWARGGDDVPLIVYPIDKVRRLYDTLRIEQRFVTSDATQDPTVGSFARNIYRQMGWRAMAAFQYEIRGAQYGAIMIHNRKAREFSNAELRFYENVARQAFVALESLNLVETTQAEAEQRAVLNEVLQVASSSLEIQTLFQEVGEVIARRQEMPVMIWHWNGEVIRPVAVYDAGGKFLVGGEDAPTFTLGEAPLIGHIIEHPEMTHIDFTQRPDVQLPQVANFEHPLEEAVFVPLQTREGLVGVLVFGRQAGHDPIDEMEMGFIRTAGINISVSLETAQLYEQAQITAEKLKEVDQLKSEFLANMSHELRTPLNSIIGFSRVILKGIDGPLTDMQKTDLNAIYESGQHLLSLINDILDISKIEAGKMEFNFEDVDLHKTVKSVMSSASALVKSKPDIDLRSNLPEDLPQVIADERRVRQVILNLLSNAAKFTEEGYIEVAATYDSYQVILSVEDTGIGIPPQKIADVFERFKQVDSSSTRRYEGTGLGMSLSRMFVQAHGGDIWVESTMGEGSTFYFSLPIGGPGAAPAEEEEVPMRGVREQTPSRTVLVVDDDESVITLFRRYLEKRGYRVFGLTSSERVVAEAKRLRPYAITLDILMPKKDGWTLIQELKDDPETHDIPLIVCSIVSDTDKGLSMGVADYLMKPIMEQELVATLERLEGGLFGEGERLDVLVVDDQPADRKLLSRVLSEAGYEVREAPGGAEAIAEIHTHPPSAVVLDLMMPEVDGFAVLEHLKANQETRDIPVIVVTAKELTAEEHERLQQGVEFLMQKGIFDQEQLLRDIETALERFAEKRVNKGQAPIEEVKAERKAPLISEEDEGEDERGR